jgi:WD40 repeat protein
MKEQTGTWRPPGAGTVDAQNPWPGLAAFREADREFFKGRDAVIDDLARLVLRAPVTVLFGVSGLGKTSLLRAGLFPVLRQNGLLPVYVRLQHAEGGRTLREQVFQALSEATAVGGVESEEPDPGSSLWEHMHRKDVRFWNERNRLVTPLIVFDQFEEVFTIGVATAERRERTDAFLGELADLVEARPPAAVKARLEKNPEDALYYTLTDRPCKVLISLREDFLADVTALASRMPSIAHHTYRLQRMNQAEALRVVQVEGIVPADVAQRVVEFVAAPDESGGAPDETLPVEPALLSVFCRELNHKRKLQGKATIGADLVEGNARTIIADFYERTMAAPGLGTGVRRLIEEKLLTRSGFRNSLAEEEALLEPGVTAADIERLIELRLLRREESGTRGHARIELTHDVLTEPIRRSRDRRRVREQEEAKLAALRALEQEERKRVEERRRRQFTTALGIAGVVAVVLAVIAVYQAGEARRALASADVERVLLGDPEPLPYLARAVVNDPDNDLPRAVLFAQLTGTLIRTAVVRPPVRTAAALFAGDGRDVATLGDDGAVRVWTWDGTGFAGSPAPPAFSTGTPVVQLRLSPDGRRAVGVTADGHVQLLGAGPPIELLAAQEEVTALEFDAPGSRLLTVVGGVLETWDGRTGAQQPVRMPSPHPVIAAAFDREGPSVFALTATPHVQVWDAEAGVAISPDDAPLSHEEIVPGAFARSGDTLALVSHGNVVRLWNARTGRPSGAAMRHDRPVIQCVFSPDGARLLTASDEVVRLWDAATGDPLGWPVRHHAPIRSAAFSSDGEVLVVTSDDGTVALWDARRAEVDATRLQHPDEAGVSSLAFSPDGGRLLTVAADGRARLWDVSSGVLSATLAPADTAGGVPTDPIAAAVFSPDGQRIVTIGGRTVLLWDEDGRPLATLGAMQVPERADAPAWIVAAGVTGRSAHVVTVANDGTATV